MEKIRRIIPVIYTDGAYSFSKNQGGWSIIINKDIYFGTLKNTTNNRMEILAVIKALIYCLNNNITDVEIYTDSMYVIGGMRLNYEIKTNLDLFDVLRELDKKLKVSYNHVKGHETNVQNNTVDKWAVFASNLYGDVNLDLKIENNERK